MSGRQCGKEELCCKKARSGIKAFERSARAGDYDEDQTGVDAREKISVMIDKFGQKLEKESLKYLDQ